MKKRALFLLVPSPLALTSCGIAITIASSSSDKEESSVAESSFSSVAHSEESNSSDVDAGGTDHSEDTSCETSSSEDSISQESSSEEVSIPIHSWDESKLLSIDFSSLSAGKYMTGNYHSFYQDGFGFEGYRDVNYSSGVASLLPSPAPKSYGGDGGLPGAIYNTEAIRDIARIDVVFSYSFSSKEGRDKSNVPFVEFGNDRDYSKKYNIDLGSSSIVSACILSPATNFNFFRLCCGDYKINIDSLSVSYMGGYAADPDYDNPWSGLSRQNPVTYSGTLKDGVSVSVPFAGKKKTLTYYTYDYIDAHRDLAEVASYTDPAEIAAYFNAFKTYPANYVGNSLYNDAKKIFGSKARVWSYYTRGDGYARSVPARSAKSGYYELDIDVDGSYSNASRGVGRLVCWNSGFIGSGYDQSPVCVYTDDHYFSFQEYDNKGGWSHRFNAEGEPTHYSRV